MSITQERITHDLQKIPLIKESVVLVHSSLKSLGYVEGGPQTVITSLLEAVGSGGTVIVPAFTGTREHSPDNPPVFDVNQTPCWTGIIPETFRKMKKVRRSCHPTHSTAAIGPASSFLQDDHVHTVTPCDKHSPFYKNALTDGLILFIGCDQESNTTIHCCEELAAVPYHLQKEPTDCTCYTENGQEITITNYLHDWNKPPTDFNKLEKPYLEEKIMTCHTVGNARVFLIKAAQMIEFTVNLLREDPKFLLK